MKKLAEGGDDVGVAGRVGVELEGRSLLRDWDRNKVNMMLLVCSKTGTVSKHQSGDDFNVSLVWTAMKLGLSSKLFPRWIKTRKGKENVLLRRGGEGER